MLRTIVALKYARGLFAAAKDLGKVKEYGEELKKVADFLASQPDILEALESPIYPPDLKMEVIEEIIKGLAVDEGVAKFLRLLVEKRRIHFIQDIVKTYQQLLDEEMGIARAEVRVATELDEEMQKALAEALSKKIGRQVILNVVQDPEILGGVRVRVGDLVLDGTVRAQLEKFKESIIRGEVS
ncbi:ATP synthase F1, delta subunit [Thermodesulfatator indicus DSM 15286]|uniref:ATP synthase subunit delta n=1 Tax=Thermodesulfatator indicus (strain DSM 15286 / JCM 11887 / CIR29812) TaxID=667014 RepID=F8A979_THEID|nr:ATP synthase F1 subunit delta [Thermodesulfatator indicus]AEH45198.1 ATP synthase F1, delta subunit [Thermodesulfatator indicus DSM 15286]